jgi:hypothetical protein
LLLQLEEVFLGVLKVIFEFLLLDLVPIIIIFEPALLVLKEGDSSIEFGLQFQIFLSLNEKLLPFVNSFVILFERLR